MSRKPAVNKQVGPQRRRWLLALAFIMAMAVLLGHIFTLKPPTVTPGMFEISPKDLLYHFSFLAVFALTYRLSFIGNPPGAGWATILVCSGWGAACEIIQHWIPMRDFSVIEFGVNVLTPVIVAGAVAFVLGRRE